MLNKRCLTGKVLAGITLGLCCAGLSAQEFNREIQLAQELNGINLQDYAQKLIDGLLEKNKGNLELRAQQAQNLVAQGKMPEAMAVINELPKNSPAYYDAQAGIGTFFVRQRKFAEGLPMLEIVKTYAVQNNLINKYQIPLAWLLTAYQDQGRAAEAQELLGILAKAEEGNSERSEREMKLAQARYGLSCIDNMKETLETKYKELKAEYDTKWKAATQNPATKGAMGGLEKQRQNAWNNYIKALRGGNAKAAETHGNIYYNAYRNIAKNIGMNEDAAVEYASLTKVKALQAERLQLILKGRTTLTPQQVNILAIKDPNDWQDVVYQAIIDMEEVQWGGLDACFFMAAANLMQAYYHLGQYEKALTVYRKNQQLFKQCDIEYKKNNEPIENSPTADARMWEGYNALGLAKKHEAKDKKLALTYYKRAFVAFGQLLMNYPRHRDGVKNYPVLLDIVEKLKSLDPGMSAALDKQLARVPQPERNTNNAAAEIEELVQAMPAQNFKDGNILASENMKKDRTPEKSTDAEWAKCREYFTLVEKELEPLLYQHRTSNGLPKVLNHLLISNGYLGFGPDLEQAKWHVYKYRTLVDLSRYMYETDDQVHHGIVVGANALWMYAERCQDAEKAARELAAKETDPAKKAAQLEIAEKNKVLARFLQDETMDAYETFLQIAPSHPYAPNVAIRLASVEFIRANELGFLINEKQKTNASVEEINALRKAWLEGFDRSIARFEFIFNNFSNRKEFIDKSYELAIEAYRLTYRLVEAADMCDRFCENGSTDPYKILKAKTDSASHIYRHIQEKLKKQNQDLQAEIDAIVDPVKPADLPQDILDTLAKPPVVAKKPAPAPAPKADAEKDKADAEPAPAEPAPPSPAEQKYADAKAVKEKYDKDMAAYKQAVEDFKPQEEKRENLKLQIAENKKQIVKFSERAIASAQEVRKWLQPGGIYEQIANTAKAKNEIYRVDTILPWLFEDAGMIDESITEFLAASDKYKDSELQKEESAKKDKKVYKSFVPGYLMKAGMLYLDPKDKQEEAEKVFDKLAAEYPNRPEGRDVKYFLAKSLFKTHKYERAMATFEEIFTKPELKETLTVGKYLEISKMLLECPDKLYTPRAAKISLRATDELLAKLNSAQIKAEEWVTPAKAASFKQNPNELKDFVARTNDILLKSKADASLIVAKAEEKLNNHAEAKKYYEATVVAYNKLIPDKDRYKSTSPYFYDILFSRAEIRQKLKDYDKASKDLIAAGNRANGTFAAGYYSKSTTMLGDLYYEQAEACKDDAEKSQGYYKKAHAAYMIIGSLGTPQAADPAAVQKPDSELTPKEVLERKAVKEGEIALEIAIFKAAKTASILENAETTLRMAKKYVQYYPQGKFVGEAKRLVKEAEAKNKGKK